MYPLSLQLYSLREDSKVDFPAVLERVAAMGYRGVEPAGFYGLSPQELKQRVEDLGMVVSSSHTPWTGPDNINEAVDTAGAFDLDIVAAGFGADAFADMDAVKRTADTVNRTCAALAPHGLKLFLHNHWWEFQELDGKLGHDHIAELCPDVLYELDTYWAANFGAHDAAAQVATFRQRCVLLHIKDGPLVRDEPHTAVGSGKMDIPAVVAAADPDVTRWLVVELDHCGTDMATAVEESYRYLVGNGLAEGNK
jgi:sugar phosphate isomerase/epimerase